VSAGTEKGGRERKGVGVIDVTEVGRSQSIDLYINALGGQREVLLHLDPVRGRKAVPPPLSAKKEQNGTGPFFYSLSLHTYSKREKKDI
jgi:hypothetical protein